MDDPETFAVEVGGLRLVAEAGGAGLEGRYGPRFDRTLRVISARWRGREYLDPRGMPDEFGIEGEGVAGYQLAGGGGRFLKLGVGVLVRPSDEPYRFFERYPLSHRFPVSAFASSGCLRAVQEARWGAFGLRLEKGVALRADGVFSAHLRLSNLGSETYTFEHYNHAFWDVSHRKPGVSPGIWTNLADTSVASRGWPSDGVRLLPPAVDPGRGAAWKAETAVGERACLRLTGISGGGCEILPDHPVHRMTLWTDGSAVCAEAFFRRTLPPGGSVAWGAVYRLCDHQPCGPIDSAG
jgi:hypothetical protein